MYIQPHQLHAGNMPDISDEQLERAINGIQESMVRSISDSNNSINMIRKELADRAQRRGYAPYGYQVVR
jgi:uncharacterized protein YoaH (UPF0181 family)